MKSLKTKEQILEEIVERKLRQSNHSIKKWLNEEFGIKNKEADELLKDSLDLINYSLSPDFQVHLNELVNRLEYLYETTLTLEPDLTVQHIETARKILLDLKSLTIGDKLTVKVSSDTEEIIWLWNNGSKQSTSSSEAMGDSEFN